MATDSSCALFVLPDCILNSIFTNWLQLYDVGRLDTAVCSRTLREQFTKIAFGKGVVRHVDRNKTYNQYKYKTIVIWSMKRNSLLNFFDDYSYEWDQKFSIDYLTNLGPIIRRIHCTGKHINILRGAIQCKHVEDLKMSGFGDALGEEWLPAFTTAFHGLQCLELHKVFLPTERLVQSLSQCTSLTHLKLKRCGWLDWPTDTALPATLQSLIFEDCELRVDNSLLPALGQHCPQLRVARIFEAAGDSLPEDAVRALLQGCPLLQETDVDLAAGVGLELRVELARRRNFTELSFDHWADTFTELAQAVLKVCPSLTVLDCAHCEWLTDAVLEVCAEHCPLLQTLRLARCEEITAQGVCAVARRCPQLRVVDLWDCDGIEDEEGDEALCELARHCPGLTRVTCPTSVTNIGVTALAQGCPDLFELVLWSPLLGDATALVLATHCRELVALKMWPCTSLTLEGVHAVATQCDKLRFFSLPHSFRDAVLPVLPAVKGDGFFNGYYFQAFGP